MPWYKTGTVSVVLNSNAVTGVGTAFIANSRVGDAFRGPDGRWYEVTNIASDTAMSISPAYQGPNANGGSYALAPMQGYVKDSADALRALVNQFGSKLAALGTTGNYDILPVTKGGTGAVDAGNALASLGAQPKSNSLSALSFQNFAADQIAYFTGKDSVGLATLTAFARSLLDDASAATGRSTLGLGSASVMPIIGAVGQANGNPTGAIIERGSNANGEYVRYADGTQICTRNVAVQRTLNVAAGAFFFQAREAAVSYPIAFAGQPSISIQATGFTYEVFWMGSVWSNQLTSWPSGFVMTEIQRPQSDLVYITYTANGRWF